MLDVFSENALRERGFTGFSPFSTLDPSQVPREPGVYAVLRGHSDGHDVLDSSVGGWFKGKNPTMDPLVLRDRLLAGTQTLYVGKADSGSRGTRGLRKRIGELARFGRGEPIGHWGGRCLWQLSHSQELTIAWLTIDDGSAAALETLLLDEFADVHGQLPFANLRR